MKLTMGAALAALVLGCAPAARADLVIFADGQVAKVVGYQVRGEEIRLFVPGGGSFTTSLMRVDRIVDDELPPRSAIRAVRKGEKDARADLSFHAERRPLFDSRFNSLIVRECRRIDVDASLVSAVIKAESNFDPWAISRKGARGLMQLMPATAARLGVSSALDPAANIRAGVRYLRDLAQLYSGNPELVLAAYNAGEAAVAEYQGVPPYRETVDYIRKILGWWKPAPARPSV